MPGLKSLISDLTVVNMVVVGMLCRMTLCQILSFLRPGAVGKVALIVSSITHLLL